MQVRPAILADHEAAFHVWLEANTARRGGRPVQASAHDRVRAHLTRASAFPIVIDDAGTIGAMACGMQAIDIDGDLEPIQGLCHIALVFVVPARWGEGLGSLVLEATLNEARHRAFERAQLWTHEDNTRSQRLYARHGFIASGQQKADEDGDPMIHLERKL